MLLLGFLTIATIVHLQDQAGSDRHAQLQLATLRTDLAQVQGAPLNVEPGDRRLTGPRSDG